MEYQNVWTPDDQEGFILGKYMIMDIEPNGEVTILPKDPKYPAFKTQIDLIYPAEECDRETDDNCALMYLNAATLLNNLRLRYKKNNIYTYVANILVAVNPYFEIKDLYSPKTIRSYQGKSIGTMPPHVFAIADKSFRDMKVLQQSQSIIVSGESGAGKTESTKYLLRYLCDLWGSSAGPIEQKILDGNPVLEAFGNAKTTRNYNSSRFGKFMEVHFDNKCQVVGGSISHYLLEKSRICTQAADERNYHVFYLLCAGAPDALRNKLNITKPDDFQYLKNEATVPQYVHNHGVHPKKFRDIRLKGNDFEEFNSLDKALSRLGISESEKLDIYTVVASVLHLGNITFEEDPANTRGGSQVCPRSEKSLILAADLMGVNEEELRAALLSRVIQSNCEGQKGTVVKVSLKVNEATNARDALAKAMYSKLFDHIVQRINKCIPFKASSYYIGVLDIAGFEYLTVNSFEQFCINYCNEKLQQFFNERIIRDEQDLYEKEELSVAKIDYRDNGDCTALIETKGIGIFGLLDEESKLPKHSADHFTMEVHRQWSGHFRLALPRTSKLKAHREIRDDEGFMIRHFAGAVCYQTSQFIEKNNDALHASLEGLILESNNPFLQGLFTAASIAQQKGKLTFISVGSKFKTQLGELMDKLKSTGTNFIRCIKPNQNMVDHQFEGGLILSQLECSGMTSVLELMQSGYPSRVTFEELHNMYKQYLKNDLAKLNPQTFCKALQEAMGMSNNDYRFGLTKIFFRPNKFAEFDSVIKSDAEHLVSMVDNVQKWFRCTRWKKVQWCTLAVIKLKNKIISRGTSRVIIQKTVKMFLTRKQHRHRYVYIWLLNSLEYKLQEMSHNMSEVSTKTGSVFEPFSEFKIELEILKAEMFSAKTKIKVEPKILPGKVQQLYSQIKMKVDKLHEQLQTLLQEQVNKKELEIFRKSCEAREKEDAERNKREEAMTILKIEMAAQRLAKRGRSKQEVVSDSTDTVSLQQLELEGEALAYSKYREQLEQEKRDHELALRLAQETYGTVEKISTSFFSWEKFKLVRSVEAAGHIQINHDLSKWKYLELRDTINTSCDIELLEACRIEFHRRLKVYHAWKARDRKSSMIDENERAPRSVMEALTKPSRLHDKASITVRTQSFFRIPFVRPGLTNGKGWWYAHFDGEFIARQMELHPDKPSILLVAGVNDMQMCELSLEETGLTRKRGAEILEHEFNQEWERNGGKSYILPADHKK